MSSRRNNLCSSQSSSPRLLPRQNHRPLQKEVMLPLWCSYLIKRWSNGWWCWAAVVHSSRQRWVVQDSVRLNRWRFDQPVTHWNLKMNRSIYFPWEITSDDPLYQWIDWTLQFITMSIADVFSKVKSFRNFKNLSDVIKSSYFAVKLLL